MVGDLLSPWRLWGTAVFQVWRLERRFQTRNLSCFWWTDSVHPKGFKEIVNIWLSIRLRFGFALLHVRQKCYRSSVLWNNKKCVVLGGFFHFLFHQIFHYEWIQMRIWKLNSASERCLCLIISEAHVTEKLETPRGLRTQSVMGPRSFAPSCWKSHQFCCSIQINDWTKI